MSTDQVLAGDKWAFDQQVTDAFDDMLERSIPAYNTMRDLTRSLAIRYVQPGTDVVDLGSSRGAAIAPLVDVNPTLGASGFWLSEVAPPMLAALHARFAREIADGLVRVGATDLRHAYPDARASVTLCVLTLQFVPIEYRWQVLQRAFDHTVERGVLLLVEKVLGEGASLHETFDAEYLRFKSGNAYTDEQIARKKASLEGVLVSVSAEENVRMLRGVGFRHVDCYWRWLNFAGWVAVR